MNILERNQERKEAYVEVIEILKHMESKYVEKIPYKLRDFFENNASRQYMFKLNKDIPFEEQKLKQSTISILAMLNYNYWCEDEEHKKYLLNKYNENEIKYQQMLMEKYSRDNLFKKDSVDSKNIPQKYSKPKWYEKLINSIKKLFNKN